ncbi:hypothetical protein AGDE_15827 [Angomonas deanei]|nr:hypothetical protein AGDE_15827 [Angomonas deanei]|eukprot:EPY18312.1 hypothetical protein AGDE_15827 [Angomonas deanei]
MFVFFIIIIIVSFSILLATAYCGVQEREERIRQERVLRDVLQNQHQPSLEPTQVRIELLVLQDSLHNYMNRGANTTGQLRSRLPPIIVGTVSPVTRPRKDGEEDENFPEIVGKVISDSERHNPKNEKNNKNNSASQKEERLPTAEEVYGKGESYLLQENNVSNDVVVVMGEEEGETPVPPRE